MDDADRAQIAEERQRQRSVDNIAHRLHETPLLNDEYQRICRDCHITIPLMRLMALPRAVRCMPCQSELEHG